MKILVFAGTTEGREFSQALSKAGVEHIVSVATAYGSLVMENEPNVSVLEGRLDIPGMERLIFMEGISDCVDATHPFAHEVTENIRTACMNTGVKYHRIKREKLEIKSDKIKYYANHDECKKALLDSSGNILLTTGSKDLETYCDEDSIRERLYARVLPSIDSLQLCEDNHLRGKHIVAMQGPFSLELNEAMIRELDIKIMVSKESGKNGGFLEKVNSCENTNTELYVIGLPMEEEGDSVSVVLEKFGVKPTKPAPKPNMPKKKPKLFDLRKKSSNNEAPLPVAEISADRVARISIIGCGMGGQSALTIGAKKAMEKADFVIGAKRLIMPFRDRKNCVECYDPQKIADYIAENIMNNESVAVLFSGDVGFASGAKKTLSAIYGRMKNPDIRVYPGISSFSYFAAKLGVSYDDAAILSIHGKNYEDAVRELVVTVSTGLKTFVLLSGNEDIARIYNDIAFINGGNIRILAGKNLSYGDEVICEVNSENAETFGEGLYILYIENPAPREPFVSGYICDDAFIHDKAPMTKREIRTLAIAALELRNDSVLYDIGAGSGSISVEAATLSPSIKVFAIEKEVERVGNIIHNLKIFGASNVHVIEGKAPEAFIDLDVPTHAFIGGAGGDLMSILGALYLKNNRCKVVITAISLETLSDVIRIKNKFLLKRFDIKQVSITNTRSAGKHTIMDAKNPVYICELEFTDEK